jgi:hypothetical protein
MVNLEGSFRDKAKVPKSSSDTKDVSLSPTSLRNVFLSHKHAATYVENAYKSTDSLHVMCSLLVAHFIETTILLKLLNIIFHDHIFSFWKLSIRCICRSMYVIYYTHKMHSIIYTHTYILRLYIRHVSVQAGVSSCVPRSLFRQRLCISCVPGCFTVRVLVAFRRHFSGKYPCHSGLPQVPFPKKCLLTKWNDGVCTDTKCKCHIKCNESPEIWCTTMMQTVKPA